MKSATEIIQLKIEEITPYENNPRRNDDAVKYVKESIEQFGFKNPIILDNDNVIIAGHTRLKAAQELGYSEVPVVYADDLTEEEIRAFRLADNKVAEFAQWDWEMLKEELDAIDIDMTDLGFDEDAEDYIDNFFDEGIEDATGGSDGTLKVIVKVYEDDCESLETLLKDNGYTYEVK